MKLNEIELLFNCQPTPGIILETNDPKFSIASVNDAFLQATQRERSDLIGKGFFEAFPKNPDDDGTRTQAIIAGFRQALNKQTNRIELHKYNLFPANTEHAEERYWRVEIYPLLNESGEVQYIAQSLIDISAQYHAEQEIKDNEEKIGNRNLDLFNFSPVPIMVYDTINLQILAVNLAAQKDYGYTRDEFLSLTVESLFPQEDLPVMQEMIESKVVPGLSNKAYVRHVKKDGTIIDVKAESTPLPSWGNNTRIVMAIDITERVRSRLASKVHHDLEHLEKRVLELNSKKEMPIKEVLLLYVSGIEAIFPDMLCSIMQVKNYRLFSWASPSIAQPYLDSIEGIAVADRIGSCGTAAFLKELVISSDIANDPRWDSHQAIALAANLHACWSYPIINYKGDVLATFGIYYQEVRTPDMEEMKLIERAASFLKVILENREFAEELRETSRFMIQVQSMANFGNWSWDVENNLVTWSDTLYTIYGLNKNEFEARFESYLELLYPDDRDRVKQTIQNILHDKKDVKFEERILRPNGELRYLKSWATLKCDEEGNPLKMIGACLDITDIKKAEEDLILSEHRFKNLIQDGSDLIAILDNEGNFQYVSPNAERVIGVKQENLLEKNAFSFMYEGDKEWVKNMLEELENKRTLKLAPIRFIDSNDKIRWVETVLTDMRNDPAIKGIVANARDVTSRVENELKIKEHLDRYNIVSEATSDSIWDANLITDELTWNNGIKGMFGYTDVMTNYQWWHERVHPDDIHRVIAVIDGNIQEKRPRWTSEYRFLDAAGNYKVVLDRGFLIFNEAGRAIRMIGAMQDITERINHIQAIADHNQLLKEISWAQAHLVRGPLARIMGISELIRDPDIDAETLKTLQSYLDISSKELDHTIREIIAKSEISTLVNVKTAN
ncbi:PAS domain S-box protein [Pedobacter metabolipauper]|uniref:histidine kinase n=1 Tax=Pedobacter metabolipauper TaxID=425513 RepID=A0A4R6SS85_9SPHI|nr:PAS domain S-box protein [Pedobacter metabolipauper]TDQ06193.1 PAS domain S-box-containing protein [Pedobacter metabolipauper]